MWDLGVNHNWVHVLGRRNPYQADPICVGIFLVFLVSGVGWVRVGQKKSPTDGDLDE